MRIIIKDIISREIVWEDFREVKRCQWRDGKGTVL